MAPSPADPSSTVSDLPLSSLQQVILTTGPFVFLWSFLRQRIAFVGAFPLFATLTRFNSQFCSLISLFLALLIVNTYVAESPANLTGSSVYTFPVLGNVRLGISEAAYLYHVSAIYQYVDVILLVGQGKVVHEHMAFHHLTMPYLTYFRVLNADSDWRVFALANSLHHVLMYAYFGGASFLRPIIVVTGWVQLALGVCVDAAWMVKTRGGKDEAALQEGGWGKEEGRNRGICLLLLIRFSMLYHEQLKGKKGVAEEIAMEDTRQDQGTGQQPPVQRKEKGGRKKRQ